MATGAVEEEEVKQTVLFPSVFLGNRKCGCLVTARAGTHRRLEKTF